MGFELFSTPYRRASNILKALDSQILLFKKEKLHDCYIVLGQETFEILKKEGTKFNFFNAEQELNMYRGIPILVDKNRKFKQVLVFQYNVISEIGEMERYG